MESVTWVQVLDEAVFDLLRANALKKSMNLSLKWNTLIRIGKIVITITAQHYSEIFFV